MKLYPITTARLRTLEQTWQKTINRFRGPAPMGLALAHMLAESNGKTEPLIWDARRRPVGLMGIPLRVGSRYKYDETYLKVPVNNIYVWSLKTNDDAQYLHQTYPTIWTIPDYDLWLAVRLLFIMGNTSFNNLLTAAKADGSIYTRVSGIQLWVRTRMGKTKPFGLTLRKIVEIMDHLDDIRRAMQIIDGKDHASYAFSDAPTLSPGAPYTVLETVV
jgi:hypothetical protein